MVGGVVLVLGPCVRGGDRLVGGRGVGGLCCGGDLGVTSAAFGPGGFLPWRLLRAILNVVI